VLEALGEAPSEDELFKVRGIEIMVDTVNVRRAHLNHLEFQPIRTGTAISTVF